jgi:shikimate dehydrogenase
MKPTFPQLTTVSRCGVIGNPIEHSLSPQIHQKFAGQFDLPLEYQRYQLEFEQLADFITHFFADGGVGLNITLPFKQHVFELAEKLSESAAICHSVNTLWLDKQGVLNGDTTDGAGLMMDLERLSFATKNQSILVVGAGGAATAVVHALLKQGAKVTLHNRSAEKVTKIIDQLSEIGQIHRYEESLSSANNSSLTAKNKANQPIKFDGLICGLSEFNQEMLEPCVDKLTKEAFIYDLNYAQRAQLTLDFFRQKGFTRLSDGYGMLVGQAARSFEIWHQQLPKIEPLL